MPYAIEMFPDEVMELNRELATPYHPPLAAIMHALPTDTSFAERIGHIAAYCDLILDGEYMPEDIAKICGELVKRLEKKRILPEAQTIVTIH